MKVSALALALALAAGLGLSTVTYAAESTPAPAAASKTHKPAHKTVQKKANAPSKATPAEPAKK